MKLTKESRFVVNASQLSVLQRLVIIQELCKVTGEKFDHELATRVSRNYEYNYIGIFSSGEWDATYEDLGYNVITYAEWLTMVDKPGKLDAYLHMSPSGFKITCQDGNQHSPLSYDKFNLLSSDEYMEKYSPALMLYSMDVEQGNNPNWLKIGSTTLSKDTIRGYMSICAVLNDLTEGYKFFKKHTKELGL